MRRVLLICGFTYIFFLLEFIFFTISGGWFNPELLVILVVFFNLYLGIRYGLLSGLIAGVIKDSFGIHIFGTYMFLYMTAAFLATILRRNFYRPGSRLSRLVVTGGVVVFFFIAQAVFYSVDNEPDWGEVFQYVVLPGISLTLFCATFIFIKLKNLSDKLRL